MSVHDLPAVNAFLNTLSAVFLLIGHRQIKLNKRSNHRRIMILAFSSSCLFLLCYVYYHYNAGVILFKGQGFIRPVYFSILISHVTLAIVILPLAIITLTRGLRDRIVAHKKIAHWTYPLWLYVSITGVIVYVLLYHYPQR
jgi:putative membrane protein